MTVWRANDKLDTSVCMHEETFKRQVENSIPRSSRNMDIKTPGNARCQRTSSWDEARYEPMTAGYSLSTERIYDVICVRNLEHLIGIAALISQSSVPDCVY